MLMWMPNFIKLSGFSEFDSKLKNLPKQITKEIGGNVQDAALNWAQRAKTDAPVDQGRLKNEIKPVARGALTYEVVANVDYAAYIEWGTKTKVSVPGDIAGYAAQFRGGRSSGGNAKEMIYAWMNRVGIPKDRQWIVFINIIVNGIRPHPFFFIQRPFVEKEFVSNVRNILKTEH